MAAVNHTIGVYEREERALPTELRNALPATVRIFRPEAPDYYRPAFSPEVYSRILTDREERANYTSLEVSDRIALGKGRWVFTTGLRQDIVRLEIDDRRVGAARPHVQTGTDQLTYHLGANYQAVPSRLLLFATTSTAFEPSTRVDARTGRVQANEMTRGYEAGIKGRFFKQTLDISATGFLLYNEAISRRNPLYDDPIFDANQTQPQLVAAGEERFSGGKLDARWTLSAPLTFSARVAYAEAITTASPDLPEEVGRQMTRVPPYTASASARYSMPKGRLQGVAFVASWNYISAFTAQYEDDQRHELSYPGYGLVGLSANRSIKRGRQTHNFGVSVRNALDRDLLATQARLGVGREWVGSWRVTF
jgi:iron complex outermembrane recepter protein